MGRIPDDEVARLKREAPVLDLVRAAGIEVKRHGQNWLGRCPFHDDRTPSLVVTPAKNLWHCLGVCQAGGSVIDWVMRWERVSFRHAVELLRRREGLAPQVEVAIAGRRGARHQGSPGGAASTLPALTPAAAPAHPSVSSFPSLPPIAFDPAMDDATLLAQVVRFYHATLLQSPEALAYLASRGLDHRGAIETFRLGHANRTLAYQLPPKALKAGSAIRSRLQAVGVLRASGHEHLNGSLVVPVIDADGRVRTLYGRKLRDDLRDGTPVHLYLPGPQRGVWNAAGLVGQREVILCEALLDALTFWAAGYHHVTASYGVHGFTAEHLAFLRQQGVERVLIAYDRDQAGDTAAAALAEQLMHVGIACYRVQFPHGMDANLYAEKVQPAAQSLGLLLRHAIWMGSGPAPERRVEAPGVGAEATRAARDGVASSNGPVEQPCLLAVAVPSPTVEHAAPLATPEPPAPVEPPALTLSEHEVVLVQGERRYRVRGLAKASADSLRLTLVAEHQGRTHADTLELYAARPRAQFIAEIARVLGLDESLIQQDVGTLLLQLESLRDQQLAKRAAAALPPSATSEASAPPVPPMTVREREEALALLRDPALLTRIPEDFAAAGVVGESTNVLVGYLATISRLLPRPLAVIIQSASAAGKTSLMDALLQFVPPEHRVHYAAMTGQALYYLGERDLEHKVLSVVEEEGAERASYALKLLQSEGELTIASTGKDPHSGKLVTHTYRVAGPVQLLLTTTALTLDEELANRALVLTVDESAQQTRRIHQRQREARTLDGLLARSDREHLVRRHQQAQRLLEPLAVVNPWAPTLRFLDGRTRTRRDHEKYLTLIDAIALLHQHQRAQHTVQRPGGALRYVEVTQADIQVANRLAAEVLARSLDELPPQTRRVLTALEQWVTAESVTRHLTPDAFRFRARELREALGLGATQTKLHLARLVDLEYVLAHRAPRGQGQVYELAYQQKDATGCTYDPPRSVFRVLRSGGGRPLAGGRSGVGRGSETPRNAQPENDFTPLRPDSAELHVNGRAPAGSHVP